MKRSFFLAAILFITAMGLETASAEIVGGKIDNYRIHLGRSALDQMGNAVCGLGDINSDDVPDYVIAAHYDDWAGGYAGRVIAYSGSDYSEIWHVDGENSGDYFGHALADLGDLDGDGVSDLVVSAIGYDNGGSLEAGKVYALSGVDGSEIWTYQSPTTNRRFGTALSSAGDINLDGYEDLIAGMPSADYSGRNSCGKITVLNGRTGNFMDHFYGGNTSNNLGTSVAGIDDLNGDDYPDMLVGVPGKDFSGMGLVNAGRVIVLSGRYFATGGGSKRLKIINGEIDGAQLGTSVASPGDVNGDGLADILAGAPYTDVGSLTEAGRAYLYSGSNSWVIDTFSGKNDGDHFGKTVAAGGDIDSDGIPDCLIAAPYRGSGSEDNQGSVYAYSGRTEDMIGEWQGDEWGGQLGSSLASIGDLDGNGTSEFIAGCPKGSWEHSEQGEAWICGLDSYLNISSNTASIGGDLIDFQVAFPSSKANDPYMLLYSLAGEGPTWLDGIEVPLTPDGVYSNSSAGNYPAFFTDPQGNLNYKAEATITLNYSSLPGWLVGMKLHCAVVVFDGGVAQVSSIVQILEFTP